MKSLSQWVGAVGERVRRTGGRAGTTSDSGATRRDESRSSLFRCPDCEAVYIATDKDTCSTCETTVQRVPSTPAETA
ncbi:hypothetical protein [Halorussus aquaticus]|uniref:Small CPxCG-related zinc finger protein n=1 Tax=Halorussus aquaticus TaxID=2953748 RepID=A0ABD5Q4Q2_9EURY|nr:hypothetical protein [Halorussus aquaticus]